jgi:hypothetical protein
MAMGLTSVGKWSVALESDYLLVCSRDALQSLQLAALSKAPGFDISVSWGAQRYLPIL